jgi:hypothetical protein
VGEVFRALGEDRYAPADSLCPGKSWPGFARTSCSTKTREGITAWGALFDRTTSDGLHFLVSDKDDFRSPINLNTWLVGEEAGKRVPLLSAFLYCRQQKRGSKRISYWTMMMHDYVARKAYGGLFKDLPKPKKAAAVYTLLVRSFLEDKTQAESALDTYLGDEKLYKGAGERDEIKEAVLKKYHERGKTAGPGVLAKLPGKQAGAPGEPTHQVPGGTADFSDLDAQKADSGCYITTAACRSLGLPDDCEELVTLRWFRDNVLSATEDGRREIAEYYATAPGIVAGINGCGNADSVYRDVHRGCIVPGVAAVHRRDFSEARSIFRALVSGMQARYLGDRSGTGSPTDLDEDIWKHV